MTEQTPHSTESDALAYYRRLDDGALLDGLVRAVAPPFGPEPVGERKPPAEAYAALMNPQLASDGLRRAIVAAYLERVAQNLGLSIASEENTHG